MVYHLGMTLHRSAQRCPGSCCVGIEAVRAWPPGLGVCWLPGGAGEDGTRVGVLCEMRGERYTLAYRISL